MLNLSAITHCKIHPAIGIARLGNSENGMYVGPEMPGRVSTAPNNGTSPYKDEEGRLLRMACRFRIYGYDSAGKVVGELTADSAQVDWRVHVANSKAAWYQFQLAMDIPEAAMLVVPFRNAGVKDRSSLVNDPGPHAISGRAAPPVTIDGGSVFDIPVTLGELRTDAVGRLLFLGGHGVSGSQHGTPATTFANNDGWYDDSCDGAVDATVTINGHDVPVTGAWVVAAPPDYGPGIYDISTMWDVVFDVATKLDPGLRPARPSFSRHIYPIFSRFTGNQWANGGFAEAFGWGQPLDFSTPAMKAVLGSSGSSASDANMRGTLFSRFRDPAYRAMQPGAWPPMYGDGMDIPPKDARQWLAVTGLQYEMLSQWAEGDFDNSTDPWPDSVDEAPIAEQPRGLDQAALEACLGGPFHPGCEITWPMRQKILYDEPFRIKRRTGPEPDYGPTLDQQQALSADGPLDGSVPGDLSRWMAVPWQTDTSSCLYAYVGWDIGMFLPTFWPARVPNDILTQAQYEIIMDESRPLLDRLAAFDPAQRAYWLRRLGDRRDYATTINRFVHEFGEAGVVAPMPGPAGPDFPDVLHVETGNTMAAAQGEAVAEPVPGALPNPREFR